MATITNLPRDVLEIIACGLPRTGDIINLSLACRGLYQILSRVIALEKRRRHVNCAVDNHNMAPLYIVDMRKIAIKYLRDNRDICAFAFVYEEKMAIKIVKKSDDINAIFNSVTRVFLSRYQGCESLSECVLCSSCRHVDDYCELKHGGSSVYTNMKLGELLDMIPPSINHHIPMMFNIATKVLDVDKFEARKLVIMYRHLYHGSFIGDRKYRNNDARHKIRCFGKVIKQIKWTEEETLRNEETLISKYKHLLSTNPAFDMTFLLSPEVKALYEQHFGPF